MKTTPLLKLEAVSKNFGGLRAVNELSLEVNRGPVHGLIGPNGAGKTTVFNLITGVFPCSSGAVYLENEELTSLKPYHIARLGVSRTFQTVRLFPSMSTWENLLIGQNFLVRSKVRDILPFRSEKDSELKEQACEALHLLGLWELRHQKAITLSYGDQRKVEIARAIVARPKLVLLDEPTAGMNTSETAELLNVLTKLHDLGITIMVIEHDMRLVMGICEKIFVLNFGQKIAEGTPKSIRENEGVLEAYLGREE
jgi:branched-chain amino acid transport system ATP-binding protein